MLSNMTVPHRTDIALPRSRDSVYMNQGSLNWINVHLKKNFVHYFIYLATSGVSCGKACGILVPQPGTEPASFTLQGGFLTTGPPGKSCTPTFELLKAFNVVFSFSPYFPLWIPKD